jgi:hypothetical protein
VLCWCSSMLPCCVLLVFINISLLCFVVIHQHIFVVFSSCLSVLPYCAIDPAWCFLVLFCWCFLGFQTITSHLHLSLKMCTCEISNFSYCTHFVCSFFQHVHFLFGIFFLKCFFLQISIFF